MGATGTDPVYGAAPGCVQGRCQFSAAKTMIDQTYAALLREGKDGMSQALWCDQGGHAFSERDPGRQRIAVETLNEDTGEEERISKDFCGQCAQASGLTTKRVTRPKMITHSAEDS